MEDEDLLSSEEDLGPSDSLQCEAEWPPEPLSSSSSSQTNMDNADLDSGPEGLLLGTRELVDEAMAFNANIEASNCYCDLLGLCYSYQSGVSVQRSRRLLLCLVIFIA